MLGDRHTIETRVGKLAVRVVGDGPAAVLWPSLFMDERSWDRLLPTLIQDRRLVIINGPGHGASGDPGRRYSLHDCVTATGQILEQLAIDGAVDWVGNAWGGHVGLRFAADRPARCRSLITLGTPVAALTRGERRRTYPLLVVHGVLGPIELVLSGVTDVLLSAHTRAGSRRSRAWPETRRGGAVTPMARGFTDPAVARKVAVVHQACAAQGFGEVPILRRGPLNETPPSELIHRRCRDRCRLLGCAVAALLPAAGWELVAPGGWVRRLRCLGLLDRSCRVRGPRPARGVFRQHAEAHEMRWNRP